MTPIFGPTKRQISLTARVTEMSPRQPIFANRVPKNVNSKPMTQFEKNLSGRQRLQCTWRI